MTTIVLVIVAIFFAAMGRLRVLGIALLFVMRGAQPRALDTHDVRGIMRAHVP